MPEVLDIIHKITYEANEDVILSLNKAFGNQFKQLQELYAEQKRLEELREKSATQDIAQQTALTAAYNKNKQSIDNITIALGKEFAANEKLQTSLVKTGKNLSSLSFAGSQLLREAPAFTYSIQTGILALSNNIPILLDQLGQARKAGATTTEIFKSLGSSIFGITGLITIAVSALTIFGDKLFRSGEAAKEAKDEYQKFLDTVGQNTKQALKSTDEQISKEKTLLGIVQSSTASQEQRNKALKELKNIFPSLPSGALTDADIATLNKQIAAKEKSNALSKDEVLALEQVRAKDIEIAKQRELFLSAQQAAQRAALAAENARGEQQERRTEIALQKQKELEKEEFKLNDLIAARSVLQSGANELQRQATDQAIKAGNVFFNKAKEDTIFKKAAKDTKELNDVLKQTLVDLEKVFREIQNVDDRANPNSSNFKGRFSQTPIRGAIKTIDPILPEDNEKQREEDLEKQRDYYIQAFNFTIEGLQTIYDAKLRYYDLDIAAQEDRVERARELAERGNTQILESEVNRLQTLEAERERVAQRQIQLNALLQASQSALAAVSAIQTVAQAGTLSGPAAPVVIAATVAALAAGFATITQLATAFNGFEEGGFTGTGRNNEAAGIVHRNEFVMDAENTKKYMPILKAMHTGTFERMYPTFTTNNTSDNKGVEKKLDMVVSTLSNLTFEANNTMDGNGVTQMIRTTLTRERNRRK